MDMKDRDVWVDPAAERLWTSATVITFIRVVLTAIPALWAIHDQDMKWVWVALVLHWIGDSLDGEVARRRNCETRIGAVMDMVCDRFAVAVIYLGMCWIEPMFTVPVAIYMFEFMVVDSFLSMAFLAWPIKSPNYFFVVDERIWKWNWSRPGKAANSGAFAVLLLLTGWWQVGLVAALALLIVKCVSLGWLFKIGLPTPTRPTKAAGV
ncbi:MAG: CDP-alcohol phosphatidyltransferase family protein [Nocardioides sp.]